MIPLITPASVNSTTWMHQKDADKAYREKATWELLQNATSSTEQILEEISLKTTAVWPPTSNL